MKMQIGTNITHAEIEYAKKFVQKLEDNINDIRMGPTDEMKK